MMYEINISSFLKKGDSIKVKHDDLPSWVNNTVFSINDDLKEIDIVFDEKYIENQVMIGDIVNIKYNEGEYEYFILGWVSKIKNDESKKLSVKVHSIEKHFNKRKSKRYDVYLSMVAKNNQDNKGVFGIVINISKDSLGFVVNEQLLKKDGKEKNKKDEALFSFEVFINANRSVSFEGVILRESKREKGIEYGAKMKRIDDENSRILNEFVYELENKNREYYNKRDSYWSKHSKYN